MLVVIYLIPVACNVCTYCNIAFYLKCILAHTRAKSHIRDMLIAHQQPHVWLSNAFRARNEIVQRAKTNYTSRARKQKKKIPSITASIAMRVLCASHMINGNRELHRTGKWIARWHNDRSTLNLAFISFWMFERFLNVLLLYNMI